MRHIKKYGKIVGIIVLVFAALMYFVVNEPITSFISFFVGVLSIVSSFFFKNSPIETVYDELTQAYENIDEEREKHITNLEKSNKKLGRNVKAADRMLAKITYKINQENINKTDILNSIQNPLNAIVFFKTWEDTSKRRKLFMNVIYPKLGVIPLRAGLSIIPPRRIDQTKNNSELINWFNSEISGGLPEDYEYNMFFVSVIDLKASSSLIKLRSYRKFKQSFLDKIPLEELIPSKQLVNFLAEKEHLSTRDIIEIPNLIFLVDEITISRSDFEILRENNSEIVSRIGEKLKIKKIKTTDFSTIDELVISDILIEYVKDPKVISSQIVKNAILWKKQLAKISRGNS